MSLYKGFDGVYKADIRFKGLPRLSLSMRTTKRTVAQPRYDAVKRLSREALGPSGAERRALLEQLRTGALTIERLESMVTAGEPLVPTVPVVADTSVPWPTVDVAIERYTEWLKSNPNKRYATWENARAALRRFAAFVIDELRIGDRTLDAVTSAHVEAYQRSLMMAKASANTVSNYMARIGALWSWVQRRENRNAIETRRVASVVHSPLDREVITREQTARDRWLTHAEATRLLTAAPPRLLFPIAAGLFCGFRIGEVLSLRLVDIDLEVGMISIVAKQIGTDAAGAPILWKPKTRRSERIVPIPSDLRPILEAQISQFASDAWLVPAIDDPTRPFPYTTFNLHFATVVTNAGMISGRKDPRGVVFHTLRHTFASWLIMTGNVDLYTAAQLLGDTLQVVEDTYAHLAPDFKKRAIDALKGAIAIPPMSRGIEATETTATGSATEEAISA